MTVLDLLPKLKNLLSYLKAIKEWTMQAFFYCRGLLPLSFPLDSKPKNFETLPWNSIAMDISEGDG